MSAVLDIVTDPRGDLRTEAGFDIAAAAATFRTTFARKREHAG
ncbi:MAG TPA: hypothetical protein VFH20_09010 [Propionibacteriaceae bacterium]|nr:hypothetical protein [Propionibacteriaceae bacterium]